MDRSATEILRYTIVLQCLVSVHQIATVIDERIAVTAVTVATMRWQLTDYRLVTASAYAGLMAPLTEYPSCVCVLSGDADPARPSSAPPLLSLEGQDGVRRRWQLGDVSRLAPLVPNVLADLPDDDRPLLVVPPRASEEWATAVSAWPGPAYIAASPPGIADRVAEDKIYVRRTLARLGVTTPEAVVIARADTTFKRLRTRLGAPFVLQNPNGVGGQGTYLIRGQDDVEAALIGQPLVDTWLASRFAGNTTINVAGVVHRDGVQLFPASLQVSGIEALGVKFGAYCGSQFGDLAVPERLLREAQRQVTVVGHWLQSVGHLGLFGVDVAVSDNAVAALEINPRIQGSSWLLSALQVEGRPCLEQHVLALLGAPLSRAGGGAAVASGSHLLLRWRGAETLVHAAPAQRTVALSAEPGHVGHLTGLPAPGVVLQPGAIVGRLRSDGPLTTGDGHTMLPGPAAAIDQLIVTLTNPAAVPI